MGAPLGNKNAVGGKGGGRPSLEQERANLEFLVDIWEGNVKLTRAKLEKKLNNPKKKYGAKEMFAMKCLTGNDRSIEILMKKLFPDRQFVEQKTEGKLDVAGVIRAVKEEQEKQGGQK